MISTVLLPWLLDDSFPLPLDRPFRARDAWAAGISRRTWRHLVKQDLVRHLTRNVYGAAQLPDTREVRAQALALIAPPLSVVSDWTACWYWAGMDRPGRHLETEIDVFRFRGNGRLRNGLARSGQRWFGADDVVAIDENLLVSTPLRTAWDLGRLQPGVIALAGMDALLRAELFDHEALRAGVERFRRQRGVVQLRWLAPRVNGGSESFGESGLRYRWYEASLPEPQLQVPIMGRDGVVRFWGDLGLKELRFIAEYDGEQFHGPEQAEHDAARRLLMREEFGFDVEVFRGADVFGQHHNASVRLNGAFSQARRTIASRAPSWTA